MHESAPAIAIFLLATTCAETPVQQDKASQPQPSAQSAQPENIAPRPAVKVRWLPAALGTHPASPKGSVDLRVSLLPDGTVTEIGVLNDLPHDTVFQHHALKAIQSIEKMSPLQLPTGTNASILTLRFKVPVG